MARKGLATQAEPLINGDYDKLIDGLRKDKLYLWELYCRLSYYTALRVSDVTTLKWSDILLKDSFYKTEKKTQKTRKIKFNQKKTEKISELYQLLGSPDKDSYIIAGKKTKDAYSSQYINRKLKYFRIDYRLKIKKFSTHTFRKTFGRQFYENSGRSPHALMLLCRALNHKNPETTLIYIGIVDEEIENIYDSIDN